MLKNIAETKGLRKQIDKTIEISILTTKIDLVTR